jgi:O-antigen/teichoic acid export membrane protein
VSSTGRGNEHDAVGAPSAAIVQQQSLRRDTIVRIGAESAGVLLALLTGVLTARALGADNKGALSALLFLMIPFTQLGALGLGEASVVLAGRGSTDLRHAMRASLPAVLAAASLSAVLLVVIATIQIGEREEFVNSVLMSGVRVVVAAFVVFLTVIVNGRGRFVFTSIVMLVNLAVTGALTLVFVTILDLAVLGAVTASVAGSAVALVALGWAAWSELGRPTPVIDVGFLRRAVPIGLPLQASIVLVVLSARLDQLFVLSLESREAAGQYAVALTFGQLAAFPASALATVAFPRLAALPSEGVVPFTERIVRLSILAALSVAVVLGIVAGTAIPFVFGVEYQPSVVPAVLLLVAGVPGAVQWILARSMGARGHTRPQLVSYLVSLTIMIVLDVLLIPRWGARGAAVAAMASSTAGAVSCLAIAVRVWPIRLRALVPTMADARMVVGSADRP